MFTPYYILAVGFGAFAVVVSMIGIKGKSDSFPGRFYGPILLVGVLIAVSTLVFVWRGGEKEEEHRKKEETALIQSGAAVAPLAAVRR